VQTFMRKTLVQDLTLGTLEEFQPMKFQTMTSSVADFPVSHSVLLAKDEDSKIREARYFSKLLESQEPKELHTYSLKMLRDYSPTTTDGPLRQLSPHLMSWGMTRNGFCLTARTLEFRKVGKECSLSEILENFPDQKYFLSEKKKAMFTPTEQIRRIGEISPHQGGQVYSSDGVAPTLTTGGEILVKTYKDNEFRKLTPLECERLQGFPDGWTSGASKTQRYKQLGNSVTVNVIEEIAKKFALLKVKQDYYEEEK
jgi:hypothetical protein